VTRIRLAFSPDSDDAFMFLPLLEGEVDAGGFTFEASRADTESLNALAEAGEVDVVAVSIAQYARIADRYLLLPHGASVGRGYGPVVVARERRSLASLQNARIAIPGERTTAALVTRLLVDRFEAVEIPIVPYAAVFDAVKRGDVDAAVVIHEGRLLYEKEGLFKVCDLGEEWARVTGGLPLPLGGNAIRRGLGEGAIAKISRACSDSIAWALAHKDAMIDKLHASGGVLDRKSLDRYLTMYANEDTRAMAPDVRAAVAELFKRGGTKGLVPQGVEPEFSL
jgi:1,4-dihydroxy-6-naphthoate synthase